MELSLAHSRPALSLLHTLGMHCAHVNGSFPFSLLFMWAWVCMCGCGVHLLLCAWWSEDILHELVFVILCPKDPKQPAPIC